MGQKIPLVCLNGLGVPKKQFDTLAVMLKTSLRLLSAFGLLLPAVSPAAARVVVGAAARSATFAPAPLGAFRAPLVAPGIGAPTLIAPSLQIDAGLPTALPMLEAGLPVTAAPQAAIRHTATAPSFTPGSVQRTAKPLPGITTTKQGQAISPINRKKNPVRHSLATTAKDSKAMMRTNLGTARFQAGRLFDGFGKHRGAVNAADAQSWRNPDWSEDRRINRALRTLYDSETGGALYDDIRRNHSELKIRVDTDRESYYDARMRWEDGSPVLYLTESLVDNDSKEVVAAYIAREFTDLYFNDFPASAELNYLAHGSMLRVFAELTDSGMERYNYWWDQSKDQRVGNSYAMESYYSSWKQAAYDRARYGTSIGRSEFFEYLKDQDISNKDPNSRKTVRQHYRDGNITYSQYRDFTRQFDELTEAESSWFGNTGRW